tara:strand:+ start:57627 stop:57917 length:291 start_codon:yes stop_codon:yes gene_type:complete
MQDPIHIFEEDTTTNSDSSNSSEFTMESVRSMVKQMNEIDDDIKRLRDDKKELFSDFIEEYNVPKKEVLTAVRMLKGDIDPEVTTDIYTNIADLVE